MKKPLWQASFWRGVVLGVGFLFAGVLWALLDARVGYRPTPEALELAWPRVSPPHLVLVMDPECPMCQRLESDLEVRGVELPIRYLPALGHSRSRELWLARAEEWGLPPVWVDSAWEEVRKGGPVRTPVTIAVRGDGVEVLVGYPGYERWRSWVAEHLGL